MLVDDEGSKDSQNGSNEEEHADWHANSTRDDNENLSSAESPLNNGKAVEDLAESVEDSFNEGKP